MVVRTVTSRVKQYVITAADQLAELHLVEGALTANNYEDWALQLHVPSKSRAKPSTIHRVIPSPPRGNPC